MSSVSVQPESPRTADATRLLDAALAELARRYGPSPDWERFPVEDAEQEGAAFLVARLSDSDSKAVGCVVLRPLPDADEPPGN